MRLPDVVVAMGVPGEFPEEGPYYDVISPTDQDMHLRPDPSTVRIVPWAVDPTAQVIHDCYDRDGRLIPYAPRAVLRLVCDLCAADGWDPVFAFHKGGSIEDLLDYWQSMVKVYYDSSTHLIEIRVLAFAPEDAQRIAQAIFDKSTVMINRLNERSLDHAVLDVFALEPLPVDSPLWSHEFLTVLPHISAPTNVMTASKLVAENLRRFFHDVRLSASGYRLNGC